MLFVWMKQERVGVPEEGLAQVHVAADSAGPEAEVDVDIPEVRPKCLTSYIL